MEIPAISGHHQKKQLYLQDKIYTPRVELTAQLGVFLSMAGKLDYTMGMPIEFDNLLPVMRSFYAILTIKT